LNGINLCINRHSVLTSQLMPFHLQSQKEQNISCYGRGIGCEKLENSCVFGGECQLSVGFDNKADDLTIKKLTHGIPTMKGKFDAL
jgi:hypothetical protein